MNLSDILGIIGLVFSVVGIPITFILARRGRQKPEMRHAIDFDVILDPTDELHQSGLDISISGQQIRCISRTRVAIWNHRGDPVRGNDIVDADRLRVQLTENDKLLQARVLTCSRLQNCLNVTPDPADLTSAPISFDFLDSGDGGIIEIIHQGTEAPSIEGTIRGATLAFKGKAKLDYDTRKVIASRFFFQRIWGWRRGGLRSKIAVTVPILYSALFLATLVANIVRSKRSSHLANPKAFDLSTIEGQAKFAAMVDNNQIGIDDWLLPVVSAVGAIAMFYVMSRRVVPSKIVATEISPQNNA